MQNKFIFFFISLALFSFEVASAAEVTLTEKQIKRVTWNNASKPYACYKNSSGKQFLLYIKSGKLEINTVAQVISFDARIRTVESALAAAISNNNEPQIQRRKRSLARLSAVKALCPNLSRSPQIIPTLTPTITATATVKVSPTTIPATKTPPPTNTNTPVAIATNTLVPPTITPTNTRAFPTFTPTIRQTSTIAPTSTPVVKSTNTPLVASNIKEELRNGLVAWRSPDKNFPDVSCATCHAPDGYDLAMIDYPEDVIVRRSEPHVGSETALKIAKYIKDLRQYYKITKPYDRLFRPFQPGGEVLPGATMHDRDYQFVKNLDLVYSLRVAKTIPISSLAEAKLAKDQLLAVDVKKMKIGIPFNRWTEDPANGVQHSLISDWIPDLPMTLKSTSKQEIRQKEDIYINDPSDTNFWSLYNTIKANHIVNSGPNQTYSPFERFIGQKRLSSLIAQHIFRNTQKAGLSKDQALDFFEYIAFSDTVKESYGIPNPFWDIGDFSREFGKGANCPSDAIPCIPLDKNIWDQLTKNVPMKDQLEISKLPWFYVGWFFDQGLLRTGSGSTHSAEYFLASLYNGRIPEYPLIPYPPGNIPAEFSFPSHNTFMYFRKLLVESFIPESFSTGGKKYTQKVVPNLGYFSGYGRAKSREPSATFANGDFRFRHRTFLGNSLLMMLYLYEESLLKENALHGDHVLSEERIRADALSNIGSYEDILNHIGGEMSNSSKNLLSRIKTLISNLKVIKFS
jgi:hypothetical protein